MTKKFWADWQKRVGETENIYLYDFCEGRKTNVKNHLYNKVLCRYKDWGQNDKIIKFDFHGDAVDLVIERNRQTFNYEYDRWDRIIKTEYLTLHREEISGIKFRKL